MYAISEVNLERQTLLAAIMAPVTERLLDRLRISPGSRCLDLGCGIGETTRQLASRVGGGEVIGIDQDVRLIETARSGPVSPGGVLTFQAGDAASLRFEDETFELVFARYLLHHLEDPGSVLAEMLRVCKPGGTIAVQEPDAAKLYCYPESWAYRRLPAIYKRLFANAFIGRELYSLFRSAGCKRPGLQVETIAGVEVELRRSYRLMIEAIGPSLIAAGILGAEGVERLLAELRRVEQTEDILCVWSPIFSVWGKRERVAISRQ